MFNDVGKGIMRIAKFEGWCVFLFFVVAAFYSLFKGEGQLFFPMIFIGLFGFISAWPLYGIGQVVDDIHAMRMQISPEKEIKKEEPLPEL